MDRPLGRAVGTALETAEAIDVLRGGGPSDTKELSLELTASLIRLSGLAKTERQALSLAESRVADGEALTIFNRMIEAQGAEPGITEPGAIPLPDESASVKAAKAGMITAMDTEEIGWALKDVAGAIFEKKTGDRVVAGEVLFRTYGDPGETAADRVAKAITIGPGPVSPTPLIIAYL
jgi:thymidine phosphorylase